MVMYSDGGINKIGRELLDEGLYPMIRLYRKSSDGLKMRVLREVPLEDIERDDDDIVTYALNVFGTGDYCAKLFSTKYGRNILECRYDFGVANIRDIEDEEDF